jgi:hypothetical protein
LFPAQSITLFHALALTSAHENVLPCPYFQGSIDNMVTRHHHFPVKTISMDSLMTIEYDFW